MSGIFGLVDTASGMDAEAYLKVVQSKISHFSWHVANSWTSDDKRIGLGRSSIGIFNAEQQPVTSANGDITLMMVGEFYQTDDIRQTMTADGFAPRNSSHPELALCAFQAYGDDFARTLKGVFFIAIFDAARGHLILTNDRFGLYTHYYSTQAGKLAFAPEVKGVLCAPFITKTLNLASTAEYMRFQQVLGVKTFHEGILLFPRAGVGKFELESGEWTLSNYWNWGQIPEQVDIPLEEASAAMGQSLRDALTHLTRDTLRPGIFLSGGLDSRTLLGLMPPHTPPVVSATFGIQGCRDVYYAEQVAKAVGSQHYWFDLPNGNWVLEHVDLHLKLTEGFHNWVHMHSINMLSALRGVMDYNLTGWAGEFQLGYPGIANPLFNNPVDLQSVMVQLYQTLSREHTWPGLTESEALLLYTPEYKRQLDGLAFESFVNEFMPYERYYENKRTDYFFLDNHCRRMTGNMVKIARSHLEVRFPYWDYNFINLAYSLNPKLREGKPRGDLYMRLLTREAPKLARIPYDKDEFLPTSNQLLRKSHALMVRARRRLGVFPKRPTLYADYENYLRHELRGWAESILFDRRTQERGIFNMSAVQSLFKRHIAGYEEWTIGKIAPLITFEMMMREYFD